MNNEYILYGIKDSDYFYIINTDPLLFTSNISEAKRYISRINAMNEVINSFTINSHIKKHLLDSFYIATIENNEIIRGIRIL